MARKVGVDVQHVVTHGTFSLDGGTFEVDNNVWIVGDAFECLVIDPAHDAERVAEAVGARKTVAILLTHGHDDHIRAAREAGRILGAPIYLNHEDQMLWEAVYPGDEPDHDISDGQEFVIGSGGRQVTLRAIHTPGHTPGSTCFYAPELGAHGMLFSGDTLFQGGPGATGRQYSDFPTIIDSIRDRLFTLPAHTKVATGHGDYTTIGQEEPHLGEWLRRGY